MFLLTSTLVIISEKYKLPPKALMKPDILPWLTADNVVELRKSRTENERRNLGDHR